MLAEQRSRQKWSDDPRNTRWATDKSKFGYQMLTKMGWEEGSGLGQTLQGTTSHIKIRKKKNAHGIGMKTSHDDDWIAHQDSFNALLSQLNSGDASGADKKIQSLEDRVRITKTKIMYSRFVKSKDLSRASSNDLACIFGQRSKSAPATPQRSEDEDESLSDGSTASCPTEKNRSSTEHGFTTISSGVSVADYFAKKMAALKQGRASDTQETTTTTENSPDEEPMKKKKKKKHHKTVVFDDIFEQSEEDDDSEASSEKKKKKRKKKHVENIMENKTSVEAEEEVRETKIDLRKKKKKKKESRIEDDEQKVVICEKKEYSRERVDEKDDEMMSSNITLTSPKKKSKKKKHEHNVGDDENIVETDIVSENQTTSAKKSKKKKRKHEDVDETLNDSGEERKKKRKRRHQSDYEDEGE